MATVNNPVAKNYAPASPSLPFNTIWMLTRLMKKAGWKHGGSANGTSKTTSLDPAADLWNGALGVGGTTNVGAAAATIAAPDRGRALVSGLTGIVAADKGRFLVISGSGTSANNNAHQIEEIISATEVRIDARTFAVAAEPSNCTWVIKDATAETYPAALSAAAGWELLIGPTVLRVPFTSFPAGRFLRGENVVQSTTGAEGELISIIHTTGAAGYLVILPRVRGSSAPTTNYGWVTGNNITGSASGAVVAQNGTANGYTNEVVFWKAADQANGSIFVGCFDSVADTAEDFLTLKSAAGCTATVAPGGGGTGNAFPTHAFLAHGLTTSASHQGWMRGNNTLGNAQIMTADAIEEPLRSADGTWVMMAGTYGASNVGGGHQIYSYQYMEDHEAGDVNPWVYQKITNGNTTYTHLRVTNLNSGVVLEAHNHAIPGQSGAVAQCWLARGTTREKVIDLEIATFQIETSNVRFSFRHPGFPHRDQAQEALPLALERFWYVCADSQSATTNYKTIKGHPRWMRMVTSGSMYNVYRDADNAEYTFLQTAVVTAGSYRVYVLGPWDGSVDAVLT